MRISLALLTLIPVLSLSACSGVRGQMGLTRSSPDEFKVVKNAPLEIPTNFSSLPAPQPGAPRPQERAVTEQVKANLFGGRATNTPRPSAAEALLLQHVGASASQTDIRTIIDRENSTTDLSKQPVAKRLLGIGDDINEDNILDAKAEAERLKEAAN